MTDKDTKKSEGLKPVEVGVGAGAAVITAFASSYLGTAGTLTGAALASVVGTVSTSVLRRSADRSADQLRRTSDLLREKTGRFPVDPAQDVDPYGTQLFGAPKPDPEAPEPPRRRVRPRWVVLAAGAVIAFAVSLALITGIESAAGKPLAGLVGQETGGGTTIGRATGTDSGTSTPTTPTPTPTSVPTSGSSESATPTPTETGVPSTSAPTTSAPTTAAPTTSVPAPTGAPSPLVSGQPTTTP